MVVNFFQFNLHYHIERKIKMTKITFLPFFTKFLRTIRFKSEARVLFEVKFKKIIL